MTKVRTSASGVRSRWLPRIVVGSTMVVVVAAALPVMVEASGFSFTAGDVVVFQVGTGSTSLTHKAFPVSLAEYTTAGSKVTAVALPTTASGSNKILTSSGSAASTGSLAVSQTDGYLTTAGYEDAVGNTRPQTTKSATVPRTVARVSTTGTVNTTTALTDFSTSNNARAAYTTNGSTLWVGGANGGVRYTTLGATTSTALRASTNVHAISSFAGQLYASVGETKTHIKVSKVGTGFPKTGGTTLTPLTFTPTTSSLTDSYGFSLLRVGTGNGPDTLYVATDKTVTTANVSTIHKYCLTGSTWKAKGTIALPTGTKGLTGLTANVASSGSVTIYATSSTTGKGEGRLYKFTDTTGFDGTVSGTVTKIATAPSSKYAFRSVAFAPGTHFEPTITSPNSLAATVGSSTSLTVTTTGTPTPTLSEHGSLPNGVTFQTNGNGTATLSGTPASGTAGSYPIHIDAHNSVTKDATQSFTLTVNPSSPPTISTAYSALPAALGVTTNPTLGVTVGSTSYPVATLTVTATSSNPAVAASASVSGTGSTRALTVTPGTTVGTTTITLSVKDPSDESASAHIEYGLSASVGHSTARYYAGAGNGSSAVDVGTGYMLLVDDLSNVIRLYKDGTSGEPVKTFAFTTTLPYRTTTADFESAARVGTTVYFVGSESLSSKGNPRPATDTVFAAHITGTGANVSLSYLGSYTGLRTDLIKWDESHGTPLGLKASATATAKSAEGFNIEGTEFAAGSTTTAYLGFRAPLEPTNDRSDALAVPVTNFATLSTHGNTESTTKATFGTALEWNLGGRGIREIRKNATNQYLIIAGTPTGTNNSFGLYSWNGTPSVQPKLSPTPVTQEADGAWESIVSVPDPLVGGDSVELVEDNGDTAWYGGTSTSKSTMPVPLQKDLGQTFVYQAPTAKTTTSTSVTVSSTPAVVGQTVTVTATVSGSGTPSGKVTLSNGGAQFCTGTLTAVSGHQQLSCSLRPTTTGTTTITATYAGDSADHGSSGSHTLKVDAASTTTSVSFTPPSPVAGQPFTATATVSPVAPATGDPTGAVTVVCTACQGAVHELHATLSKSTAGVVTLGGTLTATAGAIPITAAYSGDGNYKSSTTSITLAVAKDTTEVSVNTTPGVVGQALLLGSTVTAVSPGTGTPTGTVTFALSAVDQSTVHRRCALTGGGTGATCTVTLDHADTWAITASYLGDSNDKAASAQSSVAIARDTTTTTVDVAPSTVPYPTEQTAAFTVTVTTGNGEPVPNGETAVVSVGTGSCTAHLTAGTGTCSVTAGTVRIGGPYHVSASYPGDANLAGSTSTNSATLTVTEGPLESISITPVSASIDRGQTEQFTALGHYVGGATANVTDDATWSSSVPSVATVSTAGLASGVSVGQTTVSAAMGAVKATATLTVLYPPPTVTGISSSNPHLAQGATVTVAGTGFTQVSSVDFGSVAGSDIAVTSPTSLTVREPEGVGTVTVTVTAAGGTSADVPADRFSYPTGTAEAWGRIDGSSWATGATGATDNLAVVPSGLPTAAMVANGGQSTLVLGETGHVFSYGEGWTGELGNGQSTGSASPVEVEGVGGAGVLSTIVAVAAHDATALALSSSGTVYAWGEGNTAQIPASDSTATPVVVKGPGGGSLPTIVAISAGTDAAYALSATGHVYAWGEDLTGQLGDGLLPWQQSLTVSTAEVQGPGGVGDLSHVIAISTGCLTTYALTSTGTVFAWGSGETGALGDGSNASSGYPVEVEGLGGAGYLSDVANLSAGWRGALAVLSTGHVDAWGNGSLVGHPITTPTTPAQLQAESSWVPVQVEGPGGDGLLSNVVAVAAGQFDGYALTATGHVYSWGVNWGGQLGTGSLDANLDALTPVEVLGPTGHTPLVADELTAGSTGAAVFTG